MVINLLETQIKPSRAEAVKRNYNQVKEEEGIAIGYHIDHYTPMTAEWLRTFNTDSATECFTAVQELKKIIEKAES